jgi:hypothetical protein
MKRIDRSAAVWAGVISGVAFMILEMVLVAVFLGMSPWAPPRMIAAIVMGKSVLPMPGQPATFSAGVMMAAIVVHFTLSIFYAIVLAWIIRRQRGGRAALTGAAFGLALYLINFYGFTAIFPWFAMARDWVSILSHILFGVVAAWAYVRLRKAEEEAPRL